MALIFCPTLSAVSPEEFKEQLQNTMKGNFELLQELSDEEIAEIVGMDVFQTRLKNLQAVKDVESVHYDSVEIEKNNWQTVEKKPLVFRGKYTYFDYDRVYSEKKRSNPNPTVRVEIMAYTDFDSTYFENLNVREEMDTFMNSPSGATGVKSVYSNYEYKRYFEYFPLDPQKQALEKKKHEDNWKLYKEYHQTQHDNDEEKPNFDVPDDDTYYYKSKLPPSLFANLRGSTHYHKIYQPTFEITWIKTTIKGNEVFIGVRIMGDFDFYVGLNKAKDILQKCKDKDNDLQINVLTFQLRILSALTDTLNFFNSSMLEIEDWDTYTFGAKIVEQTVNVFVISTGSFVNHGKQIIYLESKKDKTVEEINDDLKEASELKSQISKQSFKVWDLIKSYYKLNNMKTNIKKHGKDGAEDELMTDVGTNICMNTYFLMMKMMENANPEDPTTYVPLNKFMSVPTADLSVTGVYSSIGTRLHRMII